MLTFEKLKAVAARGAPDSNIRSIIIGLQYAEQAHLGLHLPHRYVQFAAQVGHESGRFRYDEEVWGKDGGTAAQKKYDVRTDLGNTPERDGDGFLFRGRTGLQATGRANYVAFREWCKKKGFPNVPDFEKNPDAINTDPWEGLFPIYYWDNRKLNRYADSGDIETITKRVNGGLNGFDDRIALYTDLALMELGYPATVEGLKAFQRHAQKLGRIPADEPGKKSQIDGDPGPKTRSALHLGLVDLGMQQSPTLPLPEGEAMPDIKAAPVTEEKEVEVEVAVVPEKADKTLLQRIAAFFGVFAPLGAWLAGQFTSLDSTGQFILIGIGVVAVGVLFWRGERIAAKARSILDAFGA
jgi:putative chitinase